MNFPTMCIFVGGSFLGWLIGALFKEAPDKFARDREKTLLASLVELRDVFEYDMEDLTQEERDMLARADFAIDYSNEVNGDARRIER